MIDLAKVIGMETKALASKQQASKQAVSFVRPCKYPWQQFMLEPLSSRIFNRLHPAFLSFPA